MIALLLSVFLLLTPHGVLTEGTATWYGSTHPKGQKFCYGGYRNTCNPYSKGEKVWYAAVGSWKEGISKPYKIQVCRRDDTTRCVVVVVRDYCLGAEAALKGRGNRAVDLSPKAFLTLAPLRIGVVHVIIKEVNWNTEVGIVLVTNNKWRNQ
jgi:hypothetical protein